MAWFLYCLRNYAAFTGRAGRPEYWWYTAVMWVITLGIYIFKLGAPTAAEYLRWFITVATFLPGFAVGARRLHDTGNSAWWLGTMMICIGVILIVGYTKPLVVKGHAGVFLTFLLVFFTLAIRLIYLFCKRGDAGPNKYGPPPPSSPHQQSITEPA